ncbi:hypothetical protein PHLH6_02770 [Pseudomonas sp. Seg1]|nr:hypothetical protein PHLH6_02770 [Pseudomonas sp. Seg1]
MHSRLKLILALTLSALLLGGCMRFPDELPQLAAGATMQAAAVA